MPKKILYYDCFAGISGDMNLGAMIDLGIDESRLREELAKLPVSGYELRVRRDKRRGVEGIKADVVIAEHHHEHDHEHTHEHSHADGGHHHHHGENRNYAEIKQLISGSALSVKVKDLSLKMFAKIAEAEGKIHGKPPEEVHFHEVGAVDSIVDIVGAAVCYEALGVDEVIAGFVEVGSGFVKCAHGTFPVPAPATAEILKDIPVKTGGVPHEATTPTGAAILAVLVDRFTGSTAFTVKKIGYGLGTRDAEVPNVLRLVLAEAEAETGDSGTERVEETMVECNLDDMVPERLDLVIELLFKAGAKDVFLTPVVMKKSRPALTLSVLAGREALPAVREILFIHTTTLGIREYGVTKRLLPRTERTVVTPYGELRIKEASYRGRIVRSKPEYDDLKRLAVEHGVSIDQILAELCKAKL